MNFFSIYLKLLHVLPLFIKKFYSKEEKQVFDTPELIIDQITALKLLLFSDRDVARLGNKMGVSGQLYHYTDRYNNHQVR
jgi:hypothetical protein